MEWIGPYLCFDGNTAWKVVVEQKPYRSVVGSKKEEEKTCTRRRRICFIKLPTGSNRKGQE